MTVNGSQIPKNIISPSIKPKDDEIDSQGPKIEKMENLVWDKMSMF